MAGNSPAIGPSVNRADRKEISQWLILGRSQLERGTVGNLSEGARLQRGRVT
jgi:hypothetical protein